MKITADTNLLVRLAVNDDPQQAQMARELLNQSELVAVPLATLCEFVWVLRQGYGLTQADAARAVRTLLNADIVNYDKLAAAQGLAVLDAGGDFADGVIAYGGWQLGADEFATFDRRAAKLVQDTGLKTRLLTTDQLASDGPDSIRQNEA
ncbi:MAG: type II toxin-antitoxin system VapC family toxin [Propionibacteriaceae bacterium]|nr:type II toxin-antitoxin system VapC family toxin [Propionibacteriaceae bacterium]